ncbi:MAG: FxsA family protein [Alphaproteobacteria bacterium]|nr:MAG: FxsA family protein [Alphaproteobacteria bacterium]
MPKANAGMGPMSLVKWTLIGLLVLPAAELFAFFLVAALIGWLWAAGLFIATSILGALLLRRFGRADLDRLRTAFARDGIRALHLETPGMATMLGGILLIFPGFITDLLGAALLLPTVRRWAAAKLATFARSSRRTPRDDRVLELEPGEWHQIPDRGRRRRRKSKRGA